MIVDAKKVDGIVQPRYEVMLECSHCGMEVDDVEYTSGTCSDCGKPWEEKRHVSIHVTSVPMAGKTM